MPAMPGSGVKSGATLMVVVGLLMLSSVAQAKPGFADNITVAEGPISTQTYEGILESEGDVDWYWGQLAGDQEVTLTYEFEARSNCEASPELSLDNSDGEPIEQLFPADDERQQEIGEYKFMTPEAGGLYYIALSSRDQFNAPVHCEYKFSLGPSSVFGQAPPKPPVVSIPEPNDFESNAYGPMLAGTTYQGTIDTSNDADQLYFVTRPHRHVEVQITAFGCGDAEGRILAQFTPANYRPFSNQLEVRSERRGIELINTEGENAIFVKLHGSTGCSWQAEVGPPEALVRDSEAGRIARTCGDAKRILDHRRVHLHRAERTLHFTYNPQARRQLQDRISARRRGVDAARQQVKGIC
jgi:hypothetical protein